MEVSENRDKVLTGKFQPVHEVEGEHMGWGHANVPVGAKDVGETNHGLREADEKRFRRFRTVSRDTFNRV